MKPNILYIEDHHDNMTLVKRIFRPDSYNLIEAWNGLDGISIAESQNIDLVLLDINLPDMDGYEVTRRLRASTKTELAAVPIVAITANAMKDDEKKVREAGCNDYMSKPINVMDLLDKVNTLIANKI